MTLIEEKIICRFGVKNQQNAVNGLKIIQKSYKKDRN